jgi:hypothetical protein
VTGLTALTYPAYRLTDKHGGSAPPQVAPEHQKGTLSGSVWPLCCRIRLKFSDMENGLQVQLASRLAFLEVVDKN